MACGGGDLVSLVVAEGRKLQFIVEDGRHETLNPSSVTSDYWVWTFNPTNLGRTYGKWLVFGKKGAQLNALWHKIHPLVRSGELGATGAKSSTGLSTGTSANDDRGVICVYTTQDMLDEVGPKLIEVVQMTIRYKSDEATYANRYARRGYKNICEKTLYWKKSK